MRGDGLKAVRENLVSIVKRVVEPLMNAIKNELTPHVEALEMIPSTPSLPSTHSGGGSGGGSAMTTKSSGAGAKTLIHPSIAFMQTMIPIYSRALARYVTSWVSEGLLASLLIPLIWRGLVALSNRPGPPPSPPTSPSLGMGLVGGAGIGGGGGGGSGSGGSGGSAGSAGGSGGGMGMGGIPKASGSNNFVAKLYQYVHFSFFFLSLSLSFCFFGLAALV